MYSDTEYSGVSHMPTLHGLAFRYFSIAKDMK